MHLAFHRGGRAAINKVMKQQPAVFLKLLVLLVPREMKVENSGELKAMSGEQLEAAIEAIQGMLDAKVAGVPGRKAQVIEGVAQPCVRKVRKSDQGVGTGVGTDRETDNS